MEINGNLHYLNKIQLLHKYKEIEESKYGRMSKILSYNENELLKLFEWNRQYDKNKFEILSNININNFANPQKLIYILGRLYGYIMERKNGCMLFKLDPTIYLKNFFLNINNVIKNIYELSNNNIILSDLHDQNILFDSISNEIFIIDMDEYFINYKYNSCEEVYLKNLSIFFKSISTFLSINNHKYLEKIINKELLLGNCDGEDIFGKIINELENMIDSEIVTINDFKIASNKLIKK